MFKNALVSVTNKKGLIEFLAPLVKKGLRVVSTGGTSKYLKDHGIEVIEVSHQTGFPEVMDGRVRTLHPRIHMALLARSYNSEDMRLLDEHELKSFDLVIGNLYPFEESLSRTLHERERVELIDIGGPSLLRAAAKNYENITVLCDPEDYEWVLAQGGHLTIEHRKRLASKVFSLTSTYDSIIAGYLAEDRVGKLALSGDFVTDLRYGENPQQKATWYKRSEKGWHQAEIIQGKALSYNNLLDLDSARTLLCDFEEPCIVIVKHNNPCGVGLGPHLFEATEKAISSDPVSVFGGIVACNREVTREVAQYLEKIFLECVVAPSFDKKALEILSKKKNLRLLSWPELHYFIRDNEVKTIEGGYLVQSKDQVTGWNSGWTLKGKAPSVQIKKDIEMSWKVSARLKSNAISVVSEGQTLGLGMGQVNRVDAVEQALLRVKKHHHLKDPKKMVLASDAFFPFPDSIELIANFGIEWVVQPGGSLKDDDVFHMAEKRGVHLIITHCRHFRH